MQLLNSNFLITTLFLVISSPYLSAQQTTEIKLSSQADDSLKIDVVLYHVNVFYFDDSLKISNDTVFFDICFSPLDAPSVTTENHSRIFFLEPGSYHFAYTTTIEPDCFGTNIHESFSTDFSFPIDQEIELVSPITQLPPESTQLVVSNLSLGEFQLKGEFMNSGKIFIVTSSGSIKEIRNNSGTISLHHYPSGTYHLIISDNNKIFTQTLVKI